MDAVQIVDKVRDIIVDQLGVTDGEVLPDSRLDEDLACDSLDVIELSMAIEAEFGLEIPDDDVRTMKTVRDIHEYLAVHAK